jgi:hypothetical protein
MTYSRWESQLFTGSGHAQSMLVTGRPLLSTRGAPKPRHVGGPWQDPGFVGRVELWWRGESYDDFELRWKGAGRSAQVPWPGLARIVGELETGAWETEFERLEAIHGPEAFDDDARFVERFPTLADDATAGLLVRYSRQFAVGRFVGYGWHLELRDDEPIVVLPGRGQRQRRLPVCVLLWAVREVPILMGEPRTSDPSEEAN